MRPRFSRLAMLTLAVLGLVTSPARAGYVEAYNAGMTAVDQKDWPRVIETMRTAIAQQPARPARKIRSYGMRLEPYRPYYYLGLAYYRQGQYVSALEALQQSTVRSDLGGILEARQRLYIDICKQRILPSRPLPPPRPAPAPHPTPVPPSAQARPPLPVPPQPDPQTPPRTVEDALIESLGKAGTEALAAIERAESLVRNLESRKQAALRRNSQHAATLDTLKRHLYSYRHQLVAGQRERDPAAAGRAKDGAQAVAEELEELDRAIN